MGDLCLHISVDLSCILSPNVLSVSYRLEQGGPDGNSLVAKPSDVPAAAAIVVPQIDGRRG